MSLPTGIYFLRKSHFTRVIQIFENIVEQLTKAVYNVTQSG